jgi:hypothetical protein
MDKAIIFGGFDFISFHVCITVLNKGLEVKAIHIEEKDKIEYLEEKRLEVGRNANFLEQSLVDWTNKREKDTMKTTLVFSLYDLYMRKIEALLQNETVTSPIIKYIEQNKRNTDVVFILPIQMSSRHVMKNELVGFLAKVEGLVKNVQLLYLPTIYGPWQPSTFLFQQAIFSKLQKTDIFPDEREWTKDTLFVDDAMELIFEIIETGIPGGYLLESGRKDYWFQCAKYLNIEANQAKSTSCDRDEPFQTDRQIIRVSVKKLTPIEASISKQMEHVQRLNKERL